jgi:osmotically-inducible protein OsmY
MKVIAISREIGSFGEEIGALAAEKSGLEYIGRVKTHELAQACDPQYRDACALYESEHGPGFFESLFFDRPTYLGLFEALTFEQAARGAVVIVGRGAQVALRRVPGVLKVRIVAPLSLRIERFKLRHKVSYDEAEAYVRKYDKKRRNLITAVYNVDPDHWELFDLIINTEKMSADGAAEVVVSALRNMERVKDSEAVKESLRNQAAAKYIETHLKKRFGAAAAFDVKVTFETGGLVTLHGLIPERRDKERLEKEVAAYPGVTKVKNELKVSQLNF